MVFNTTKVAGNIIASADWNDFVDFTEAISGVAYDIYHSGSKYTSAYNWFVESGEKLSIISGSLSNKITSINSGYTTISNGNTISHGLGSIPSYVNITPSGMDVNFGTTCKVDSTNITVYLTAAGSRNVFWTASL